MPIDFSKISQEELDALIKEEALKLRAEMLSDKKKKAKIAQLNEERKRLEEELSETDMEEGILDRIMGKGGNNDGLRRQTVLNLLKHPHKGPELIMWASPEQLAQFKSYLPPAQQGYIDSMVSKLGQRKDPKGNAARAESYIKFFMDGGKNIRWDAAKNAYIDAGQVAGNAASAFGEGKKA